MDGWVNLERLEIAQSLPVRTKQIFVISGWLTSQGGNEPEMGPFHQLESGWGDQAWACLSAQEQCRVLGRTVCLHGTVTSCYTGGFVKTTEGKLGEAGGTEQIQDDTWSPLMWEVMN